MGAKVFGGKKNLIVDYEDVQKDNHLPASGKLAWSGIASATGLEGSNGLDCVLVHGDVYREFDGLAENKIHKDLNLTVLEGNETHTVKDGKLSTTVGKDCDFTVNENYTETVNGEHFSLNVGSKTEVKMNSRMVQQANETMETHWTPHIMFKSYIVEVASIGKYEAMPTIGEAFLGKIEVGALVVDAVIINTMERALDHKIKAMESKILAVKDDLWGLDLEFKALDAGVATYVNGSIFLAPDCYSI